MQERTVETKTEGFGIWICSIAQYLQEFFLNTVVFMNLKNLSA